MTDRFFRQSLIMLIVWALALIYISRYTNIDLILSDWMYSRSLKAFPWKETWFATVFMHQWVKYLCIMVGMAATAWLLWDMATKSGKLTIEFRRKLAVVVCSFIAIPLVISLMKSRSIHHCPWDVANYGGFAPYLRLFDNLPEGIKPGHCFPAGHASSALWLAAFSVFNLQKGKLSFLTAYGIGLIPGLALGWVQQMRGAHFLSHTLWSAWIASLIMLILARILLNKDTHVEIQQNKNELAK